jgi:peptide/nickel transport system permease protein
MSGGATAFPLSWSAPLRMVSKRLLQGALTLLLLSIFIFLLTQALPGNVITAVLGRSAAPAEIHVLEAQLHLNRSVPEQYWSWLHGVVTGNMGRSLVSNEPVWAMLRTPIVNSAFLVLVTAAIAVPLALALGIFAAVRRDTIEDHVLATLALTVVALPEFVIGLVVISLLSTLVFHAFPAQSFLPPGGYAWQHPTLVFLPMLTLVIICIPYIYRMTRSVMIDALQSDYAEMARLEGIPGRRIVLTHALRNAAPAIVQVIALTLIYLAGGIVIVENVFSFPGIGRALVQAVQARDVPVVQFLCLALGALYIAINIVADFVTLLATPRRRWSTWRG